jgi:pilus assembly protein CpaE
MFRIAIVDPSDATRDPLRSLLLGVDFIFLEAECSRYEFFPDVVNESPPDLAIVSLDAEKSKAANLVGQIVHDHPRLPILVISGDNQAILQTLQRGAKYFLTQPVVLEDLLGVLRKIQRESHQGTTTHSGGPVTAAPRGAQIVSMLGTRGGVGCTTLAVNLAATLAADPANTVGLVDLDLAFGDCDVALDMMADHTIADLAMNIDKLDLNYIRRSVLHHRATNVHLLAHPLQISDIGLIQPPHVERILNLLKFNFSHLILDLSKGLTPIDLAGLDMSDLILVVTQLELSSLRNAVRMLMTLADQESIADKVRVIVNRVDSSIDEASISLKKAEATIGKPIFWQVPNDSKAVMSARVAGEALIKNSPKCRSQLSLQGLAAALTRKDSPAAHPSVNRGFKKGIFSKK